MCAGGVYMLEGSAAGKAASIELHDVAVVASLTPLAQTHHGRPRDENQLEIDVNNQINTNNQLIYEQEQEQISITTAIPGANSNNNSTIDISSGIITPTPSTSRQYLTPKRAILTFVLATCIFIVFLMTTDIVDNNNTDLEALSSSAEGSAEGVVFNFEENDDDDEQDNNNNFLPNDSDNWVNDRLNDMNLTSNFTINDLFNFTENFTYTENMTSFNLTIPRQPPNNPDNPDNPGGADDDEEEEEETDDCPVITGLIA